MFGINIVHMHEYENTQMLHWNEQNLHNMFTHELLQFLRHSEARINCSMVVKTSGGDREVVRGAAAPHELLEKIYFHWFFENFMISVKIPSNAPHDFKLKHYIVPGESSGWLRHWSEDPFSERKENFDWMICIQHQQ